MCRMDDNGADIIGMGLKRGDLLARVVVVDADLAGSHRSAPATRLMHSVRAAIQIIRPADNPVLPGDEAAGTDRHIGELEGLDDLLGLV